MPASSLRFTRRAAATMRAAITEAGGVEIFAIGQINRDGDVESLEVHCRGNQDAVPALLSRPRPGEVVIHNHPSGKLEASQADMMLANRYGEDGVGVVIVDNTVKRALWVVEPYRKPMVSVSEDEIRQFFSTTMLRTMPGYESRDAQIEMALRVAETLNEGNISVTEAGTGTGKSLAYLVPATLWALKNEARVAVATFTINLQSQLVTSDIPVMQRAGLEFRYALLKGRSNYLCRRRLKEESAREGAAPILQRIAEWADHAAEGSRSDMAFPIEEEVWDLVASDHDQTLRARCPHFNECFYYQARREAANAHLLVVNHHLLLADLLVKSETGGDGILPRFDRLILDEGHHLEDAATSLFRQQATARAIRRSTGRLISRRKRPGALERLLGFHIAADSPLPPDRQKVARKLADQAIVDLTDLHDRVSWWMENLASSVLSPEKRTVRITPQSQEEPFWELSAVPTITGAAERLARVAHTLGKLENVLKDLPESFQLKDPQPVLDLARSRRKLGEHASFLYEFLSDNAEQVRWIEEARGRSRAPTAALSSAPIEVGPLIRAKVFDPLKAIATCSATMTVDNRFDHFLGRVGLTEPGPRQLTIRLATLPSPFDYSRQALLGLPTDIPAPNDPEFELVCARFIIDALQVSGGGAFVLCTSFRLLRGLHRRVSEALGSRFLLLRQGEMGRARLLEAFRNSPDSVLFGTDSFWEGVSVKGDSLRLVIIPRLPFRVPTDPVQQARHELLAAQGVDPFRTYSLPQAVLRFRQGFGRLIRTQSDRGSVLVLDKRVRQRWYGRVFIDSLPELETISAPGKTVLENLRRFYQDGAAYEKGPPDIGQPQRSERREAIKPAVTFARAEPPKTTR